MNENQILFSEEQKFNQWWIWALFLFLNGIFLNGLYQQLYLKIPFGNKPMSDNGLIIFSIFMAIFTYIFIFVFKLQTQITSEGISVRFFPFHLKFKKYAWDEIVECYVRKYNPLMEYGGWGLRMGFFGKGYALNVSGNMGLQLKFTDSKKLLIGTQKNEELEIVLLKLGKIKNSDSLKP